MSDIPDPDDIRVGHDEITDSDLDSFPALRELPSRDPQWHRRDDEQCH